MTGSLYDRFGGAQALGASIDLFYHKVLADPRLAPYFEGVDVRRQAAKQKSLIERAFSGSSSHAAKLIHRAHEELVERGLSAAEFDALLAHLGSTLIDLGVGDDLITEAAGIALRVREDVYGEVLVTA